MSCCRAVSDKIPARYILCFMLFTGFMVSFLQRVNLSIAIIAMVRINSTSRSVFENITNECFQEEVDANEQLTHDESASSSGDLFDWNEIEQSVILSSFFWGYVLFQIPAGRISDMWGLKIVFGGSILMNGVLALVIPFAASVHWSLILLVRTLQGLAQGTIFPCLNVAAARWVPPGERATFISFVEQGSSLGSVLALPLCGWILTRWSWPQVFYMSGSVAVAWCIAWYFLVYDTPSTHPRITAKEKRYLETILSRRDSIRNMPVPWISVFLSVQFWLGVLAGMSDDWGAHMFSTFGPKYMRTALGFDLERSSWLASLPYFSQYIFANTYATLCDVLLRKQVISTLFLRKMSTVVSHLLPALGMIALTQVGCNAAMSVAILTISISAMGAAASGYFQNPLDIAPNFTGSLTGLTNTVGALTGIISGPLTGAMLQTAGPTKGWKIMFGLTATLYVSTSLPYLWSATAQLQSWNNPKRRQSEQNELDELQRLTLQESH